MGALPLALLHKAAAAPALPAPANPQRVWRSGDLAPQSVLFPLAPDVNREIAAAIDHIRANGLDLDTVEQEDFRLPGFARMVDRLRHALDEGAGIAILDDIALDACSDAETAIIAWGLANYLGRPIRQGLKKDRRLFSVTNHGSGYGDPTRIGATTAESRPHTDNGCLEPRPPCYIGLMCVQAAREGGASRVLAAETVHAEFAARRPDLLALLYQPWHFRPPQLHTWPAGPQTIVKPIFERVGGELQVHYARVMIEPGMELAGAPLDARQREALDLLDELLADDRLAFVHRLQRGQFLFTNNLTTLHGRTAFADGAQAEQRRLLQRLWLWRRHRGPGTDPAALDRAELEAQA
jgi:alpha-ketoglutarate-dependent taurine dioxygenase